MKKFLLFVALALTLVACPRIPRDPPIPSPPPACTPRATICHEGAPWRCGPEGTWVQADRRCDLIEAVCCETPSAISGAAIHACVAPIRCNSEAAPVD